MKPWIKHSVATIALSALFSMAHAQWGWTDDAGKKQFSDQPPPSSVPDKNVFKRPPGGVQQSGGPVYGTQAVPAKGSAQAAVALASSAAASGPASGASAPTASASKPKSADEQFRERQEKAAKAEAEAQKKAQADAKKSADCERSKGYLKSLQDGVRIAKNDAKGDRTLMDDAQRASETQRVQSDISSNCK